MAMLTTFCDVRRPCSHRQYMKTESEADRLRSWDALYGSYKAHRNCDDGAAAEEYSESVARILSDSAIEHCPAQLGWLCKSIQKAADSALELIGSL